MEMAKSHYRKVFSIRWGETWYTEVISALILSAHRNEELRRKEGADALLNSEWKPYDLIIENQIGIILVLCQSYLTNIVTQVQYFHSDYKIIFDKDTSYFSSKRRDLLKVSRSFYKDTGYTCVEAIDHLANYFKHHEEWKGKPHLLENNAKQTANAVSKLGLDLQLSLWLSRNLSKAVKPLGVDELNDLPILLTIIDEWKNEIGSRYSAKGLFE